MEIPSFYFRFFALSLVLMMLVISHEYSYVSGCFDSEREALTTFKKALNDQMNGLSSWDDGSDCCKWIGVSCHHTTGFVVKLDLHGNEYWDGIDSALNLSGRIDPALLELKHLRFLDLSYNAFIGAPIPEFLGSIKELRHLNLSWSGFEGRIPNQLGNLSHLISLEISSSGSLSAENLWWLTNIRSLKYLDMSYVNLSMAGQHWVHVMNRSPSLVELRLPSCSLSYIPPALSFLNFTSLRVLDLYDNNFDSTIPNWIANISNLVSLNLSKNNFQGVVPYQFSELPNLEELSLKYNHDLSVNCSRLLEGSWSKIKLLFLSCEYGGIPNSIGNITSLVDLYLYFSSDTTGSIPSTITNLVNLESLKLSGYHTHEAFPTFLYQLKNLKELYLNDCMLVGPVPVGLAGSCSLESLSLSGNQLSGPILASLGQLSNLNGLDLSYNSLTGPIPTILGQLSSLEYLDLSGNQLNESIPPTLGQLSNLNGLDLSNNSLTGPIPTILGQLSSLDYLDLSDNQLNESIPPTLGQLSNLNGLDLSYNSLTGPIPAILGQLSSLEYLKLSNNQLNESIPPTLGQLSKLQRLDISSNYLTGNLSEIHFENLRSLEVLYMSSNALVFDLLPDWVPPFQLERILLSSCRLGPQFPPWLRTQKFISHLDISNASIVGTMPTWFWGSIYKLEYLNLANNKISGQLPNPLKARINASIALSSNDFSGSIPCISYGPTFLDLSSNRLYGPFPPNFTSTMQGVFFFSVSRNQINGTIPSSIGEMVQLRVLDLSHNNISGTVPSRLRDCIHLEALDLSSNRLSGGIPRSLGLLNGLQTLHLNNNSLSGKLPPSLKNCTSLKTLDLGDNKFFGNVPAWIGESFPNLRFLRLRSNLFTGEIPPQLSHLSSLQVLDLAQNLLSGSIPQALENLEAMKNEQKRKERFFYGLALTSSYVSLDENLLISAKGAMREYTTIVISLVTCMDFSSNNLSGEIPEALTTLLGLHILNLSRNHFTGKISDKIGRLSNLESLDLSRNQLFGAIPQSMSNLTFLSYLNFSYNNLSGRIPSGNQLRTLNNASIYMGNAGLCGPPLENDCDGDERSTSQGPAAVGGHVEKDEHQTLWLYVSTVLGFVVGFWTFCGSIIWKKSWRIAYFRYFDEKADMLYVVVAVWMARFRERKTERYQNHPQ